MLILRSSSSSRPKPAGNAIPQSCKRTWTPRPRPPAQPACSANERPGTSKTGKLASAAQAVPGFPAGARDLARRLVATGRSGRVQRAVPIKTKALIKHYARRITIEQRLAGSSRRFAPTPSPQRSTSTSTSTSCSASWSRPSPPPSGSACPATTPTPPPTPPAPLPGHPGEIICDGNSITVKINRRAYSPVLRQAHLPAAAASSASSSHYPRAEGPMRKSALSSHTVGWDARLRDRDCDQDSSERAGNGETG